MLTLRLNHGGGGGYISHYQKDIMVEEGLTKQMDEIKRHQF